MSDNVKILIVDDEPLARKRIHMTLNTLDIPFTVYESPNGLDALTQISEHNPDIVFLDIQMPLMTGFEMLEQLSDINFKIIFQTAYDEFALKAFEVSAVDYLLKPFEDERLIKAISKALTTPQSSDNINQLKNSVKPTNQYIEKITYKAGRKFQLVPIDLVQAFTSKDHITHAVIDNNEYAINDSLSTWEPKLNPETFVRTHRNSIININYIDSLSNSDGFNITLKNSMTIRVSRAQKKELMKILKERNVQFD